MWMGMRVHVCACACVCARAHALTFEYLYLGPLLCSVLCVREFAPSGAYATEKLRVQIRESIPCRNFTIHLSGRPIKHAQLRQSIRRSNMTRTLDRLPWSNLAVFSIIRSALALCVVDRCLAMPTRQTN